MKLFKRREQKPICLHEWYLIDTRMIEMHNGVSSDLDRWYTVGCTKCNERRDMDEYEFNHFSRTLRVNNV